MRPDRIARAVLPSTLARTPERAGDLIVRTMSGRTIIGAYPDDLTMT
jgi:hypothetical protein